MGKFKLADGGTIKIFDLETNEVIAEQTIEKEDHRVGELIEEYSKLRLSEGYAENKDVIRNYLIRKYFLEK